MRLLITCVAAAVAMSSPLRAQVRDSDAQLLERAQRLLTEAPLIDGHNDLPSRLLELVGGDLTKVDLTLVQPEYPADLPRLREARMGAQFWSAYVPVDSIETGAALRHGLREIDMIHRLVDYYPGLELAGTAEDIERIVGEGKIASLIGVEGGHAIESSLSALRMFHALGVRYITLTHWWTTDWADAATDHPQHNGLTEFGEEIIREMNRLGVFPDISHVSDETMKDVLRVSRAPVIFSHSSARAINSHPRNVPDDVLRMMPANGGVVMVNFIAGYIPPDAPAWTARRDSVAEELRSRLDDVEQIQRRLQDWERQYPAPRGKISDVADHIDQIVLAAGVDHVGIGSDYYDQGGASMSEGLDQVSRIPYLFVELLRRGYSDEDIMKIAGGNLLRAMRAMERVAAETQLEREVSVR